MKERKCFWCGSPLWLIISASLIILFFFPDWRTERNFGGRRQLVLPLCDPNDKNSLRWLTDWEIRIIDITFKIGNKWTSRSSETKRNEMEFDCTMMTCVCAYQNGDDKSTHLGRRKWKWWWGWNTHTQLGVCCCCHWLRMFCVAIHVGSTRCFTSWKSRRAATHTRNRVWGLLQRFNFIQLIHFCMYAHSHSDTVCVYQTHTGHTHTHTEHSAVPGF